MAIEKTCVFRTEDENGRTYAIEVWARYDEHREYDERNGRVVISNKSIVVTKWLEWEGRDVRQTGEQTYEIIADDRVICVTGPNALDFPSPG